MKRTISTAVALAFLVALPAGAWTKEQKRAKAQCRAEYNMAKKDARKAATKKERVEGVKAAKKSYDACVEKASKS